jgi:hypothetical protein
MNNEELRRKYYKNRANTNKIIINLRNMGKNCAKFEELQRKCCKNQKNMKNMRKNCGNTKEISVLHSVTQNLISKKHKTVKFQ